MRIDGFIILVFVKPVEEDLLAKAVFVIDPLNGPEVATFMKLLIR